MTSKAERHKKINEGTLLDPEKMSESGEQSESTHFVTYLIFK